MWMNVFGLIFLGISVNAQYDLAEVLQKSLLFYEAQRSGYLPDTNRIPWRGDSTLDDGSDNGVDLEGGWFDAGDTVKFGFPLAAAVTNLVWGLVDFQAGYEQAGELANMRDCVRWPLDYLVKCHTADNELYVQVANAKDDHRYWGRPENLTMFRPSYKLDTEHPGSDVAADTASALAAGYMAFRDVDTEYADTLLTHARTLYDFAYDYRGLYTQSYPDNFTNYLSKNYTDELCFGAAWLYRATDEQQYLDKALEFYSADLPYGLSWHNKSIGCQMLLHTATGEQQYATAVEDFIISYLPGGQIHYTPLGLAWREMWGSLRHSANGGFIAALAYQSGLVQAESESYLRQQIGYMLGDTGRSYVVGYGNNPPVKPHHRASSCPPVLTVPCNDTHRLSPDPNPSVLFGGLVGGPDDNDFYEDERTDYVKNEVALDYNAGFQSAIAGMIANGITFSD